MPDLMDNFKKKKGGDATVTEDPKAGHIPEMVVTRGDNMLNNAAKSVQSTVEEPTDTPIVESKKEPEAASSIADPDTWSKDSALKEVQKLRQENKKYREKYEEKIAKLSQESEARMQAKIAELDSLASKANKLDELEAATEDKKRNLEEKVNHRDQRIIELQSQVESVKAQSEGRLSQLEQEIASFRVEKETRAAIAQETLNEELKTIPDKFKAQADIFVKGAGSPSDALHALREAKLSGLFEEKSVYVNNSVPNAQTGARTTKEHLDNAEREKRSKMSSDEKIRQGLKDAFGSKGNSAVRLR